MSAAVAVIVGRAVRIRDEKERGPRGVPDYIPESTRRLARGKVCVDLAEHRRGAGSAASGSFDHRHTDTD
ncbi:hypothetical protein GTC6_07751 [Gordonia terrae C-6]|uniref:Uncharacterized protein n=1 Tax=Gordonia terrae C-6 TaxID=1316928 RepID=R7YB62_9ACTN|nr:hypothetical protein GTC6_07751 [Gordonia terrae C-6]